MLPSALVSNLKKGQKQSNLAFAFFVLDPIQRQQMQTFYQFCRLVDDIADSKTLPLSEKHRTLKAWENAFTSRSLATLPPPLADLIQTRNLDWNLFTAIIQGVTMDLERTSYDTFEELTTYCWHVASAVGLLSIQILGCQHPDATTYAEHLGLALQLTNILRDVREDAQLGRIYLPLEDLDRFQIPKASILNCSPPQPQFTALLEFHAKRIDQQFQKAHIHFPPQERRKLIAPEIMRAIYQTLVNKMRRDGFRIMDRRYSLGFLSKASIALRTLARNR